MDHWDFKRTHLTCSLSWAMQWCSLCAGSLSLSQEEAVINKRVIRADFVIIKNRNCDQSQKNGCQYHWPRLSWKYLGNVLELSVTYPGHGKIYWNLMARIKFLVIFVFVPESHLSMRCCHISVIMFDNFLPYSKKESSNTILLEEHSNHLYESAFAHCDLQFH